MSMMRCEDCGRGAAALVAVMTVSDAREVGYTPGITVVTRTAVVGVEHKHVCAACFARLTAPMEDRV